MRINTSLKGSSKYQDDAQRAFAYAEILQDYSDDIWTRITVEKNRITVKCMVDHTAIVEYDLLDTAVLTVFGQLEAAEAKRQHETGRVLLTTSPPPAGALCAARAHWLARPPTDAPQGAARGRSREGRDSARRCVGARPARRLTCAAPPRM